MLEGKYKTGEACEIIGRSKSAVLKWIAANEIDDVPRDDKNYRVWSDHDIERFKAFAQEKRNKILKK